MARNTNGKGCSLKDVLFNEQKVLYLADLFVKVYPDFDKHIFHKDVMGTLLSLELKQRIAHIAQCLEKQLPNDFEKACVCIVKALPAKLDPKKTDNDFGDFIFAPLGEYVVRNGLSRRYVHTSLATLREITMRFSMEDAIRSFLNEFEKETMEVMEQWVHDDNYHVRRLVSEGTRPLLPWSKRVTLPLTAPLPFLDILHADKTRYVTRSVANHINDIAKIEPDLVIQTLTQWKKEGKQDAKELDWIIRHSLRTLLKKGNKDALRMLGYKIQPKITLERFSLSESSTKIAPGETLSFSFDIIAKQNEKLMIDYVIDFVKANGKTKPKVFKLQKLVLQKGELVTLQKHHLFQKDATTYTYYQGVHTLSIQINGNKLYSTSFTLVRE